MPAGLLRNPLSVLSALTSSPEDTRFRHLAEQFDVAVFLVSPRSDKIIDANHKAVEFTGYSREELSQLTLSGLITTSHKSSLLQKVKGLTTGTSQEMFDVSFQTHSGATASADLRIAAAGEDGDQPLVLLLARDSQQRVATEKASVQQRSSLAALKTMGTLLFEPGEKSFETAVGLCRDFIAADLVATYLAPAQNQGGEQHGTATAPEFELWRVDPSSQDLPTSLYHSDPGDGPNTLVWKTGQQPQSPLAQAVRDSGCAELITYPIGPSTSPYGILATGFRSGNSAILSAHARTTAAAAHLTALTRLHKREQRAKHWSLQARNAELNLDTVLSKMIDGAIGVDPEGRITRVNPASERLLGYHQQEMVDGQLKDFLAPTPVATAVLKALHQGELHESNDVTIIKRAGEAIHVSITSVPVDNSAGDPAGGLILLRDLTDRKALESKARHLERRAFVGDMSARFAHEVRNPLSAIKVSLDYLKMEIVTDDPLQAKLDQMSHEADRIESLLANTLVIVKPVELKLESTDMGEFMQNFAVNWQARKQCSNISCDLNIAPDTPPALADIDKIGQVFENLLDNAMQAIGEAGGIISVTVQSAPNISTLYGDHVQVNITDKGPGIEPDVLERIFEPFFTTKKKKGTGLGLPIVQQIVKAHNGVLEVHSTPSVGTVFSVLLPKAIDHT